MKFLRILIIKIFAISFIGFANNLVLTPVTLVDQDAINNFTHVQFDISWDNSWRDTTNYDAVWIFVKYKLQGTGTLWQHATLSTSGHSVTNAPVQFNSATDGRGIFMQRQDNGSGPINWDVVKLRWDYGANGLNDLANVTFKVFAIEMVYIPQGEFNVGDGTTTIELAGQLHKAEDVTAPFLITSEDEITLGGTVAGNLGNNNGTGQWGTNFDDFNSTITQTLPAAYPKGYNAFYIMKYQITQNQYVDFLNCLTRIQQNYRVPANILLSTVTNRYVMANDPAPVRRNGVSCSTFVGNTTEPIYFFNDLNDNEVPNESDDGQHIACNYINWIDGAAYADWAGLRPITELEFEKAARGPLSPTVGEYVWGTPSYIRAVTITSASTTSEEVSVPTDANCNILVGGGSNFFGPLRAGIFAKLSTNRISSGASYYGVMQMSDNLFEVLVPIGTPEGRAFQGSNGCGELSGFGYAHNSDWPGFSGSDVNGVAGTGFRGSGFDWPIKYMRISDRTWVGVGINNPSRSAYDTMRLGRTAN